MKQHQLKFVIILDIRMTRLSICLSGQNKSIRKKYWQLLKHHNYNKYHLIEDIDDSLSIIDQTLVEEPDFSKQGFETDLIERETLKFMDEINSVLT